MTPSILRYMGRRTTFKTERQKKKAIREIEEIALYKTGEKDIYLASIVTATLSLFFLLFALTLFLLGTLFTMRAEAVMVHRWSSERYMLDIAPYANIGNAIVVFIAMMAIYVAMALVQILIRQIQVYENFAWHKKAVEERFNVTLDLGESP